MEETKQLEQAAEVGNRLHTALRKLCDSKESSYLWNSIHLLDETWDRFCQAVVEAGATTGEELKKVAEAEEWVVLGAERTKESFYARQIFRIALEDFGDEDPSEWDGFAGYLGDEV